jgi:hypothetical protein
MPVGHSRQATPDWFIFFFGKERYSPKNQKNNLLSFRRRRLCHNAPFGTISASGSNFNPQNTQCILPVENLAFLDMEPI